MENKRKELANLIFPDITETIDDLEKRYPKRNLPEGAMVTRFAPSPTGFLHTGSLFTSLIGWKLAKQSNGVFYVRLEDTDQKREIAGSGDVVFSQLKEFHLEPSEGFFGTGNESGIYGPYVQSERAKIYHTVIKYMIEKDLAYPCFCTPEDLSEMRKEQEAKKDNLGYFGSYAKCRFLSTEEAIEKIKAGKPYVIRFKSHGNHTKYVHVHDCIRGDLDLSQNDQDIVIMKSDNLPTYHFAHLVDDHFMRTTHITRGEEWLPSLPIHLDLFQSMGWDAPQYAHLPVIMKNDNGTKRKLSKRKDVEAAVSFFLESGYPKEGFIEYLMTLANSNYEAWRDENPKSSFNDFILTFEKMSLDGALFDLMKLNNVCKETLSRMSTNTIVEKSYDWACKYDVELKNLIDEDRDYYGQILGIERERENPRKDYERYGEIKEKIAFFYDKYFNQISIVFPEMYSQELISEVCSKYAQKLNLDVTEDEWFQSLKELAVSLGFAASPKEYKKNKELYRGSVGDVASIIRYSLSGRNVTPNPYWVMKILGKDRTVERLLRQVK